MDWQDTPCEPWTGEIRTSDGRAIDRSEAGTRYAYRKKWLRDRGHLEVWQVLHHECENAACMNLDHLKVTTQPEHLRAHGLPGDWGQAAKTECPPGHAYDEENTGYAKLKTGIERYCKKCRASHKKRYRAAARAKNHGLPY